MNKNIAQIHINYRNVIVDVIVPVKKIKNRIVSIKESVKDMVQHKDIKSRVTSESGQLLHIVRRENPALRYQINNIAEKIK